MRALPPTDKTLLVRTDFSNDKVWDEIRSTASQPGPDFQEALGLLSDVHEAAGEPLDGIETNLHVVDDREYEGATVEQLVEALGDDGNHTLMIVVDQNAIRDPNHSVLIVDLTWERGRTFRALPSCVFEVESNLSIGNMDWEEFVNGADDSGVYRGFGDAV
ncbi:MAG TPA: hypothetical protein VH280_03310 [Verrucomicrobiae bacterium]|jgi:hypothetical protein|nr:hypothetical protein [Verrucomicrobiae bacterium]